MPPRTCVVEDDLEQDRLAVDVLQRRGQPLALLLAEVGGRGDHGGDLLAALGREGEVELERAVELAPAGREHGLAGQTHRLVAALPSSSSPTIAGLGVDVALAVGQAVAQLGVAGHDPLEPEQLVLDPVDAAGCLGTGEQRPDGELLEGVGQVALGRPALADQRS